MDKLRAIGGVIAIGILLTYYVDSKVNEFVIVEREEQDNNEGKEEIIDKEENSVK